MSDDDLAALTNAELARQSALMAGDVPALDKLLASDFRYVHATGRVELRDAYLRSVASGKNKFRKFDRSDVSIDTYGDVAVASGAIAITVSQGGDEQVRNFRYVSVWVRTSSAWRLSFWQSTSDQQAS